jgi:hypothetical protein
MFAEQLAAELPLQLHFHGPLPVRIDGTGVPLLQRFVGATGKLCPFALLQIPAAAGRVIVTGALFPGDILPAASLA